MECVFAKTEVYEQLGEPIFHFLFTGNSQDFLKKASFFIELGLFEQKKLKIGIFTFSVFFLPDFT